MKVDATVEFSRRGWRQFLRVNTALGARFLRGYLLCAEVAHYIAKHEAGGVHLDDVCLELRYDEGVYLLLSKSQGVWRITDVWLEEAPLSFAPVYFWTRLKRGCDELLCHVLIGWQQFLQRRGGGVLA